MLCSNNIFRVMEAKASCGSFGMGSIVVWRIKVPWPAFEASVKTLRMNPVTRRKEPYISTWSKALQFAATGSLGFFIIIDTIFLVLSILSFHKVYMFPSGMCSAEYGSWNNNILHLYCDCYIRYDFYLETWYIKHCLLYTSRCV